MSRRRCRTALLAAGVVVSALGSPLAVAEQAVADPGPAGAAPAVGGKWCLRLPRGDHVVYRGVVSYDGAGTGGASFLYPAANAGGLLAEVLTHAFIVDSVKKNQKDKLQETADQVLSPYKTVLDHFDYRDLMRRAVEKTSAGANGSLIDDAGDPGRDMVVESAPVFYLTQDQKAIVLDNAIVIHRPGAAPEDAYRNTARVVSAARDVADPAAVWTANDGELLKDESALLVAKSLDIAFRDAAAAGAPDAVPYRTIRYREGAAEKIERAQVLSDRCDRLLIRTLRGTLMSVPASRSASAASATSAADGCGPGATGRN